LATELKSVEKVSDNDNNNNNNINNINKFYQVTSDLKKYRIVQPKGMGEINSLLVTEFLFKDEGRKSKTEYDNHRSQNHPRLSGYPNKGSIKEYRLMAKGKEWEE